MLAFPLRTYYTPTANSGKLNPAVDEIWWDLSDEELIRYAAAGDAHPSPYDGVESSQPGDLDVAWLSTYDALAAWEDFEVSGDFPAFSCQKS